MIRKIDSIDSSNPDYYAWGKNCAILGYDEIDTRLIFSNVYSTVEETDLFWSGYFNNLQDTEET